MRHWGAVHDDDQGQPRRMAVFAAVLLTLGLIGPPSAAQAAPANVSTTAQGLKPSLGGLLDGLLSTDKASWQTGQSVVNRNIAGVTVPLVLTVGAVTATAGPDPSGNGGTARARVAGLNLLAGAVDLDAVDTSCLMSPTAVTGGTETADLDVGGDEVLNPAAGLNINVPGVLTGVLNKQTAAYNATTGRLSYTVQGLNLNLLGSTTGSLVVGESTCSGVVRFGSVSTAAQTIVPGTTGTPTVTVTNAGEVAAPNTVITIPAPPAGYTLGEVTTTGGGTCSTASTTQIRCTGVTVPGGGSVTVSLPVRVAANAASAANWQPATGSITAVSTPFPAVENTTIEVAGQGRLVTVGQPRTDGGTIVVTQMTVPAGKTATTPITVRNQGPSDARTTITVPLTGRPAGVSITRAVVGSTPCTVTASAITCADVTVPADDAIAITVTAAATTTTAPGTTWDLSNITATLNGRAVTGQGRLLTVSDPDVNLNNGLTITGVTAVPGATTPEVVQVAIRNTGIVSGPATVTVPAPPAGYTVGAVTTTGGGSCTSNAQRIYCENVTVPAMGTVTVRVPVTLASNVTADWVTTPSAPVSATSGDSTGETSGTLVTAAPRWTFGVRATGPQARTVRPGQNTTMSVTVTNNGPSDARAAVFTVLAPRATTFGTLTGTAAQQCVTTGPSALRCTTTLAARDDVTYTLPLTVSAQADPATPLGGGCVSVNGDADCDDPGDEDLPAIQLRTPLTNRLTLATAPATITPGTSGQARIVLDPKQDETGLTLTVPLTALPAGFTLTAVPAQCTRGAGALTCTGLDLTAGQQRTVALTVAVAPDVVPPVTWTATTIVVSDGDEQISRGGDLAIAGPPVIDLAATVTGPADNTVLPGTTTQLTVVVSNGGPSDAADAPVTVVAPAGTSFGTLTGTAEAYCDVAGPRRVECTADIVAGGRTPELLLPLIVAANENPDIPLGGGCVDLDGVTGCGPDDEPIDPIVLRVPFDQQVSIDSTPATVTPGRQDVATVAVTATRTNLDNVTVVVPLGALPAGLSVASRSVTGGGVCTQSVTEVRCTGVSITRNQAALLTLGVAATPATAQGTTWTAAGITVSRGAEQVTARARLALVGPPQYVLDVDVTPPGTPVPPGGTGELTVVIDNEGPSDADDDTISVLAPDGGTFGPLSAPTTDRCRLASPTRVTCTFDLPVNAPDIELRLPVVISPGADPDRPVDGGCIDRNDNGVCDPGEDPLPPIVLAAPFDRQLDISTTPARVTPGTTGNAVVLLSASPAQTNLSVTVPLGDKPAAMTVGTVTASPSGTCAVTAAAITCTGVDVPATGAAITIPVSVQAGLTEPLTWATRAITATNAAGDRATGAGLLVRTGDPAYTLDAAITGPAAGTVLPGDTTTMRVTLTNSGPSAATNALVTLRAPVGTVFGTLTAPLADSCTREAATRISCGVTLAVAPASLVWDVPVVVPGNADPAQALTGGCLDLDGDAACGGTRDRALPDIQLGTPLGRVTTITATNPAVVPGRTATAEFTVAFSQARDGVQVRIPRDTLPAGLATTGITAAGAACTSSAAAYTCGNFTVAAGGTIVLRVALTAAASADPGSVWAPAVSVARGAETVTRTVAAATIGDADAQLALTVTGPQPGTVLPGGVADLAVTVTNQGTADARNARYVFRAPAGTTFAALNPAVAAYCDRSSATRVDCLLDLVAAGGNRQFTLQVLVPGTADPDVPVRGGCVDTNRDNGCTTPPDNPLPEILLGAELATSLTVTTRSGTATPGLAATGYVVVNADRAATGVTLTVPTTALPAGFTITSATGPAGSACQVQATQIVCTGVTLVAGANQAVAITVGTASRLAAGVVWTAAGITMTRGDDTARGSGTIVATGAPVTNVTVVLTPPTDAVEIGGTTVVTATVTNTGPSDATGATATVQAPTQTTFGTLSGQAAADCTPAGTTRLTCRFDQAVGAPARVWQLPLIVNADADPSQPASGGCVTTGGRSTCLADISLGEFALYQPLKNTVTITTTPREIAPGSTGSPRITIADTSIRDGLSLVVPVGTALPEGFTVSAATPVSSAGEDANGSCTVGDNEITCTGMAVEQGSITVTLTVAVADTVSADAKWTATNLTLTDDSSATDQLIASGVLVTTGGDADTVVTTFGSPTVNPAAPGQRTVLPVRLYNPGPNAANPHIMTLQVPAGLTPSTPLPADCVWEEQGNVVTCTRTMEVGDRYSYNIPLVVGRTVRVGTTITGGCLDAEPANGSCEDSDDQPLPAIAVVSPRVDLELGVKRKTTTARAGGTVLLKLPYSNNGSQTAAGIVFAVDPPAGVNLRLARVLLDAGTSAALVQAAAADELATIDCTPDETGDANAVVCEGPDAAVGASSELWLTMEITSAAKRGVHPVRVTVTTTSPEGNVVNNTIEALLSIAGAASEVPNDNANSGGGGSDNLAKTGQNLLGLLVLSMFLVIGGVVARVGARVRPERRRT